MGWLRRLHSQSVLCFAPARLVVFGCFGPGSTSFHGCAQDMGFAFSDVQPVLI